MPAKASGHWMNKDNVDAAVVSVVAELGRMPSDPELAARKMTGVSRAIARYHGGKVAYEKDLADRRPELFVATADIRERKGNGYWKDFENVRRALAPVVAELGRMPARGELFERKLWVVHHAIVAYHGGLEAVRAKLSAAAATTNVEHGHWQRFSSVEAAVLPVVAELGYLPGKAVLAKRGLSSAATAITASFGGFPSVRQRLLVAHPTLFRPKRERKPNGHWKDVGNVDAALLPLARELNRMPTQDEMLRHGLSSVMTLVPKYHGGLAAVADRLGFSPADGHLAEFTPDLILLVRTLGVADTLSFWKRLCDRYMRRTLSEAIRAFREEGDLDAFRALADG